MSSTTRRYSDPAPFRPGVISAGAAVLKRPGAAEVIVDEETPIRLGYGACSKCNCKQYEGNAGTCGNRGCGHAYEDHW
ncbi:MAG TPA: hypothetical protein VFJ16_12315 [Longimicrobium sp.]|nr:hypothetical protein [Longimicrobium sp.]